MGSRRNNSAGGGLINELALKRAFKASGLRGKLPKLESQPLNYGQAGLTSGDRITFAPSTLRNLTPFPSFTTPGGGLGVALHEFAHTRQPVIDKYWLKEAAAQAFARANEERVSKKLGIPYRPMQKNAYDAWIEDLRNQFGDSFVKRELRL